MAQDPENDTRRYRAIVNDEEQWSIWLDYLDIPAGWRDVGVAGTKDECMAYIDKVWTDMRPKSLREAMDKTTQVGQ
jgi:MbtH protein